MMTSSHQWQPPFFARRAESQHFPIPHVPYVILRVQTDTCPSPNAPTQSPPPLLYIHNPSSFQIGVTPSTFSSITWLNSPSFTRLQNHTYKLIAMIAAVKQSRDFLQNNDRKTPMLKAFEEFETDRESYGSSSSEDVENYSPKSVVSKVRKWPMPAVAVKDIRRCVVHSQIVRIRSEDSHLGEDIGECLIAKVYGAGYDLVDDMIFSRSASPLSGKASPK
ncbi:hypothetical protein L6452_44520 [Arctium lappa]|uniref:Uncharacterized protein n=1 Tax=Arctium lappa TaxID=4217 RepID=A0ACB8XFV9_ARCLA|nr:hypothetical protein L6452_44520 [Arctium lappa]